MDGWMDRCIMQPAVRAHTVRSTAPAMTGLGGGEQISGHPSCVPGLLVSPPPSCALFISSSLCNGLVMSAPQATQDQQGHLGKRREREKQIQASPTTTPPPPPARCSAFANQSPPLANFPASETRRGLLLVFQPPTYTFPTQIVRRSKAFDSKHWLRANSVGTSLSWPVGPGEEVTVAVAIGREFLLGPLAHPHRPTWTNMGLAE